MTPYDVLSLPDNSPIELVKKRFRELAKVSHPDLGGDKVIFQRYQDAYQSIIQRPTAPVVSVYRDVEISLQDAFLGCTVDVPVGDKTWHIPLDPGMRDMTFRYHDMGYGPGSDLYLTVTVREDEVWLRNGLDLACVLPISSLLAITGGVQVIDRLGEDIEISIPPGIQHGTLLRLPGLGMTNGRKTGDVLVEVHLRTPVLSGSLLKDVEKILQQSDNC